MVVFRTRDGKLHAVNPTCIQSIAPYEYEKFSIRVAYIGRDRCEEDTFKFNTNEEAEQVLIELATFPNTEKN